MGWCISRIKFENGIPPMEEIRKQFKKQTGEELYIKAQLNLLKLSTDNREILEHLNEDLDRYEKYKEGGFSEDINEIIDYGKKINHIDHFEFISSSFTPVDFTIKENTIELGYGLGRNYFPNSLNKVFIDLGGKFVDSDWSMPEKWNKFKHWKDYKWFNRPRK